MALETPLEIPRLVITPSTPTDDPPVPILGRGRRPTLFRAQSLLDQMDNQLPLHPHISSGTNRRTSPTSASASGSKVRLEKNSAGYHHLTPLELPTRQRPGRGTAASLVLVALAFMLVMSSALFSPESITALLHSESEWMASDRIPFLGANTHEIGSSTSTSSYDPQVQIQSTHYDDDDDHSFEDSNTRMNSEHGPSRDPRTETELELQIEADSEQEQHTTTGVMTNDAWRSYLKRKEQVTGQAGPTAHFEA